MLRFNLSYPFIMFSLLIMQTGCGALSSIGETPKMTTGGTDNQYSPKPDISRLIIPPRQRQILQNNLANVGETSDPATASSLWQSGPESLFGDRRAKEVGDILTVDIEIDDRAEFNNKTERARDSTDEASVSAAFGLDKVANKVIGKITPDGIGLGPGLSATGNQTTKGEGKINRRERLQLKIAAIVTDILPNGNFIIQGSQEVNVNYELRDLQISGIVRPHDISRKNTISYEKIAEARIYYGGRGNVSQLQQPRYGSQIMDVISPF